MFVHIKFAVDTPLSKIQIFEEAVRKFVKSRPREWAQVLGFRPSNIMQEQGYVGTYLISERCLFPVGYQIVILTFLTLDLLSFWLHLSQNTWSFCNT